VDICFLDSSALIKRYVTEIGSAWLTNLIEPAGGPKLICADLALNIAAVAEGLSVDDPNGH
jgi:hypothetical protein